MKNKELIEQSMDAIEDELKLYADSLSPNSIEYICKLRHLYDEWCDDLAKLNGEYVESEDTDYYDDTSTEVDNNLYEAMDEFSAFKEYYDDYIRTNNKDKIEMAQQELQHFLNLMTDIFSEISDRCKDEPEFRSIVKSAIKQIYTNF